MRSAPARAMTGSAPGSGPPPQAGGGMALGPAQRHAQRAGAGHDRLVAGIVAATAGGAQYVERSRDPGDAAEEAIHPFSREIGARIGEVEVERDAWSMGASTAASRAPLPPGLQRDHD